MNRPRVTCPNCKKLLSSPVAGIWPFCSERCKTQDLGAWASEKYKIAAEEPPDDLEESPFDTSTDNTLPPHLGKRGQS